MQNVLLLVRNNKIMKNKSLTSLITRPERAENSQEAVPGEPNVGNKTASPQVGIGWMSLFALFYFGGNL